MGRYALLVATWEYVDPELRELRKPAQDARELARLLEDPDVGEFDDVVVLRNEPKWVIEEAVEELFHARKPDDLAMLYLSCHGLKDEEGRLFFAALRTKHRRLDSTAISARFVHEQISRSRARSKVVLLDCCCSGAFRQEFGLAQQVKGEGSYVITASDDMEYAWEDDRFSRLSSGPDEPSVFTKAIVEGLRTGQADADRDGMITAEELYRYAKQTVAGQTPRYFDSGGAGQVRLANAVGFGLRREPGSPFGRSRLAIDKLFPALAPGVHGGLSADWPGAGQLHVPIGRTYEPGRGWQDPYSVQLTGGTGNLVVAGKTFSGKTALLCTLVCSLALTHSPGDLQIHCLRDRQEGLAQLAPLPHVGQVAALAQKTESDALVRGIVEVLRRRRRLWEDNGFRSLRAYRASLQAGAPLEDPYGELVLVIDGWRNFEENYPELLQQVLGIARQGLRYGIHLVVSVERWPELPDELRPHFGSWFELALDQPRESRVDRERAATVPRDGPGYGLTSDHRYIQVAFPELAGHPGEHDEWDGLDVLVDRLRSTWTGPIAPPLQPAELLESPDDEEVEPPASRSQELADLLDVGDPGTIDTAAVWRPRSPRGQLRVPFGLDDEGQPIELDLKESAQGGMGPHGLVIGATGSGKSELLGTLLLGLAATHSPDDLNFVLVDFKGGATFLDLDQLTHTSAVVTNLAEEQYLIDRMRDALAGELIRRQELLRASGNFPSHSQYQRARAEGAGLDPLPTLLFVIDEFSELLTAKPDFIDLFVQIGRVGRSLGVHLLLASQRLEEGKLRGLDVHLSYRIGLRTFSAAESRTVLGVPDAYELPRAPGYGFLKVDNELRRFRAAYVGSPYAGQQPEYTGQTTRAVIVDRLRGQGRPAHQIWLPPLDEPPTLDALLPPLKTTAELGLQADWGHRGELLVPIAVVDKPGEQRRDPMLLDLSGGRGNVAIVGGPQSGKSTLLRSLIGSLALTHTPDEVGFYCLDFGGGTLTSMSGLPHVGGVATRLDADGIRRTVSELTELLEQREIRFSENRIDSIAVYRRRRRRNQIEPDRFPSDVFLVIDGWGTVRADHEAMEQAVTTLAARGLGYGIHIVATAARWQEFRSVIKDLLQTKVELKLGDPFDSEIDRRSAGNVPDDRPGRGLTPDKLHFLGALPRIDGRTDELDEGFSAGGGTTAMSEAVAHAWAGPPVATVRRLPDRLPATSLLRPGPDVPKHVIPIGVDEATLQPVLLDFAAEPHLFVTGSIECGKSNLLDLIARGIVQRYSPAEAKLLLVDYRRSLLESVTGQEHLIGYASAAGKATELLRDVADVLRKRQPGPDVTHEQFKNRSWWSGSDLFVIVDDYELVATSSGNPLSPFVDLVSQARDIGLHLIVARGFGGVGRAMFDPILQRMRDLASPALIMSGNKDEGKLFGITAQPLVAGRGTLVSRRFGNQLVQTAYLDSSADPRQ